MNNPPLRLDLKAELPPRRIFFLSRNMAQRINSLTPKIPQNYFNVYTVHIIVYIFFIIVRPTFIWNNLLGQIWNHQLVRSAWKKTTINTSISVSARRVLSLLTSSLRSVTCRASSFSLSSTCFFSPTRQLFFHILYYIRKKLKSWFAPMYIVQYCPELILPLALVI